MNLALHRYHQNVNAILFHAPIKSNRVFRSRSSDQSWSRIQSPRGFRSESRLCIMFCVLVYFTTCHFPIPECSDKDVTLILANMSQLRNGRIYDHCLDLSKNSARSSANIQHMVSSTCLFGMFRIQISSLVLVAHIKSEPLRLIADEFCQPGRCLDYQFWLTKV